MFKLHSNVYIGFKLSQNGHFSTFDVK